MQADVREAPAGGGQPPGATQKIQDRSQQPSDVCPQGKNLGKIKPRYLFLCSESSRLLKFLAISFFFFAYGFLLILKNAVVII